MLKHRESFFLKLSLGGSIVLMVSTIWVGIIAHSNAILLDGILCVVDVAVTFAVIIIVNLLQTPPNKSFPFGYYKLEPLIVALEAGILIAVCTQALLHTYKTVYHGEHIIGYAQGIFSTGLIFLFTALVYGTLQTANKKIRSAVMDIQCVSWYLDTWMNGIIWIGFMVGFIILHFDISPLKPYLVWIDPSLTVVVILLVIRAPFLFFFQSVKELVDTNSGAARLEQIVVDKAMEHASLQHVQLKRAYAKVRLAGRAIFAYLFYMPFEESKLEQLYAFHNSLQKDFDQTSLMKNKKVYFYAILSEL